MKLDEFDFELPEERIAQHPLEPRDSSRLMVLDRSNAEISHHIFRDLPELLKSGDVLVVNNTRVIPARLFGEKEGSAAKIEVLLLKRLDRDRWEALIRPGKRLKIGQKVIFGQGLLSAEILDILEDGNRILYFTYEGVFESVLDRLGNMPLPPYITAQLEDKERYQTVYARERGSAAAPTAGLHFTSELLERLRQQGIEIIEILLHVGLGTFRPVKAENIEEHRMHSEYYNVSTEAADAINRAKLAKRRVIAVGTTAARTLESATGANGDILAGDGWTDIYIYPGYRFRMVDALITNFHFPKSSLVMLVSALATRELIMQAYDLAIRGKYRFYSFGDAMLIL